MDNIETEAPAAQECNEHNTGLNDRAAKRRAARELAKTGRTIDLTLPFTRNRATRRGDTR